MDVQGWGREVTTTGYGDLYKGDLASYTRVFSGTSSATPCVAGCAAALQGWVKAGALSTKNLLTPNEIRQLLRTTGLPQQDEDRKSVV